MLLPLVERRVSAARPQSVNDAPLAAETDMSGPTSGLHWSEEGPIHEALAVP